jgi:GntR family transcriptional regulator, carbon starvation induced regulator
MDNLRDKNTIQVAADLAEQASPGAGRPKGTGKKEPSRTLAGQVYERLREDIINGKLPPNMKLKLEQLISDYNVGMSPLREALSRLVGDMLVRTQGQRGFWVAPLSLKDLDEITNIRALLETQALSQSMQNGDQAWLDRIEATYADLAEVEKDLPAGSEDLPSDQAIEWERRNREFHSALISACGSEWLLRLRGIMYQQLERYRRISILNSRGHRDIAEEHHAIYQAVIQRKVLRASDLMEMHLDETAREVRRAIVENEALLSPDDA